MIHLPPLYSIRFLNFYRIEPRMESVFMLNEEIQLFLFWWQPVSLKAPHPSLIKDLSVTCLISSENMVLNVSA